MLVILRNHILQNDLILVVWIISTKGLKITCIGIVTHFLFTYGTVQQYKQYS